MPPLYELVVPKLMNRIVNALNLDDFDDERHVILVSAYIILGCHAELFGTRHKMLRLKVVHFIAVYTTT